MGTTTVNPPKTIPQRSTSSGRLACRYAFKADREWRSYSTLQNSANQVPRLRPHELLVDELLGKGGFCHVYALKTIELDDEDEKQQRKVMQQNEYDTGETLATYQNDLRRQMAQQTSPSRLAVKMLKPHLWRGSTDLFCNGAADLVMEANLLQVVPPHPHIVRLFGVSSRGPRGFEYDGQGYFLVLERLENHGLLDRYRTWRYQENSARHENTLVTRLQVARDVTSALRHLHQHGIIFRDIKAENIGFDLTEQHTVKLFDFGLAKELNPHEKVQDPNSSYTTYNMTGKTGSTRYMSPEVASNQPYGLGADVYSLSILLYEILSLSRAFGDIDSSREFYQRVVHHRERPPIDSSWSKLLVDLLQQAWAHDASQRPTMAAMHDTIAMVLDALSSTTKQHPNQDILEGMASPTSVAICGVQAAAASERMPAMTISSGAGSSSSRRRSELQHRRSI